MEGKKVDWIVMNCSNISRSGGAVEWQKTDGIFTPWDLKYQNVCIA